MEVLLQRPQNSQKSFGFFCIIGPTLQELCTQVHVIDYYRELCSTDSSFYHNSPIKNSPSKPDVHFPPRTYQNTHNSQGELLITAKV